MPGHEDIIREARTWIGTPYHHQQCIKGHGVDCGRLVEGVGVALGLMQPLPKGMIRYGRKPNPRQMRAVIEHALVEISEPVYGDIFWMCWRPGLPQHMGFYTDYGMIHSHGPAGRVIETKMDSGTMKLIHSWWRYRGV